MYEMDVDGSQDIAAPSEKNNTKWKWNSKRQKGKCQKPAAYSGSPNATSNG